jgi:TonB family protein
MKLRWPGLKTRSGRRLAGFLVLSFSAHAVAFSLFRDPGEFAPIPPPSPGKVVLVKDGETRGGLAGIFEPSAIVFPGSPPPRLAEPVILPWQDTPWPAQTPVPLGAFRPAQVGADAPLAVRAEVALGVYRSARLAGSGPAKGRPVLESWLEITGDLKNRKATSGLELPSVKSASALEPTTARIGVDEDGAVRFVFLEGTSGDPAVDREASGLMRSWRFEPAPGQWIQWGRVRVLWAVEPVGNGKP